ncbi:MAG: DUF4157 domain-containing protein, partial [Thermoanaerobaculia bacterium]
MPHDPGFEQRLATLPGTRLPDADRAFFEPRFDHNFANVRIFDSPAAGALADSVNARAFTFGESIVFGPGEYAPGTTRGRNLLAHELNHVTDRQNVVQRQPKGGDDEELLKEARKLAKPRRRWILDETEFGNPLNDADRGFREQDLAALQKQGVSLSFSGSLDPMPEPMQKLLLANITATIQFALDPKDPNRAAEMTRMQQKLPADKQFDKPAGRLDSTDLYHGHVCVPTAVLDKSPALQKLRSNPYSGFGKGLTGPDDEVTTLLGDSNRLPKNIGEARKVKQIADKAREPFNKTLGTLLSALANEPTAGVSYHSWEVDKPMISKTARLPSDHPVRNLFTPFSTNKP